MEQNRKMKLLEIMGNIYEKSKECKLEDSFFSKIEEDLKYLSDYFKVTNSQSLFIAMVFVLNYKGNSVDFDDLINHFECNPMKLLEFGDDFDDLFSKGIFKKKKSGHRRDLTGTNDQYVLNEKVTKAVLKNMPMPVLEIDGFRDVIELLDRLSQLCDRREEEDLSTSELFSQTRDLLSSNQQFPLIQNICQYRWDISDSFLYLILIWKTLTGRESIDLEVLTKEIYDHSSVRLKYVQKFMTGDNDLIISDLIELIEAQFFNDTHIKLTDSSLKMLDGFGLKLFSKKKKTNNIIEPSKIPFKELLFSDQEMGQIGLLKNLLIDENFRETQRRLMERSLPTGIAALFHGSPGTGKTELVLQLARETNREIMKVEISQSKSMWFGESEKIIKRIFTDYKTFAKESELMPILFFNEADAIISKRKEIGSSNVGQTENAIQNIILEELENFDGIFFATTNLVTNLDTAFERRFLFKLEFSKPDAAIKARIWKSKLPRLTEPECETLADQFDFSGGQIDNIIRKNEIHEILHGTAVDFNTIIEFCSKELLMKSNRVMIGFTKS